VVKLKFAQTPILTIIFGTFIQRQDFLTPTIDKEPKKADDIITSL
jgi:hypothetical protein